MTQLQNLLLPSTQEMVRCDDGGEIALADAFAARDEYVKQVHDITFYRYQRQISDAILRTVLLQTGEDWYVCISRQAGKTRAVVRTIEFLFIFHYLITGRPFQVGFFSSQYQQAKTDFSLLKQGLNRAARPEVGFAEQIVIDESNQTNLEAHNARGDVVGVAYAFPLTETSNVESKTLDFAVYEEAHQLDNNQKEVKSDPMLTATNGGSVSIGVGGFQINYFYRAVQAGKNVLFIPADEVIRAKREAFEADGDPYHLNYEKGVEKQRNAGTDRDGWKANYLLEWVLGAGQFCVQNDLLAMVAPEKFEKEILPDCLLELHGENYSDQCETIVHYLERMENEHPGRTLYVGIDSAKHPDSTVVTVGADAFLPTEASVASPEARSSELQPKMTSDTNEQGKTPQDGKIAVIAFDATGQGDFLPDWFERNTRWRIERVKFGPVSKDEMYKRVQDVIANQRTKICARETSPEWEKFWMQFLDLQKEHSEAGLLRVHHPDSPNAHDDAPDSFALMEHSYYVYNEQYSQPGILVI